MRKMFSKYTTEALVAKKVVISGYYGFKNFGDEVILSVLTNKLKSMNAEITVFSSDPQWTKETYEVNSVYSFELKSVLSAIMTSDVLISGGGSLLQDVTGTKSIIYYSLIIFLGVFFRKKVIIFAQGLGPINCKFMKKVVTQLFKRCSYVSVRDTKSLQFLQKSGITADLLCDPVYSLEVPSVPQTGEVGIQLRDFNNMTAEFIDELAKQVAKTFPNKKIKILSLQDTIDLKICQSFQKSLQAFSPTIDSEIVSGHSNSDLIREISSLEYLIAMRFHAVLTALKAGVKTLAINYDIKVEKLADEASIPYILLHDFSDFDSKFRDLLSETTNDLQTFTKTKHFDWSGFEKIIN